MAGEVLGKGKQAGQVGPVAVVAPTKGACPLRLAVRECRGKETVEALAGLALTLRHGWVAAAVALARSAETAVRESAGRAERAFPPSFR